MDFLLWLLGVMMTVVFGSPAATTAVEHVAQLPAPAHSCDSMSAVRDGNMYRIDIDATAHSGAEIVGYVFDFGDSSGLIATESPYILATFGQVGVREIRAMVLFDIGGDTDNIEVDSCQITIYPPGA